MNYIFTRLFGKKDCTFLKSVLGLLVFASFLPVAAQKAPSNFVTTTAGASPFSYTIFGYGPNSGDNYGTETDYSVNFGKANAGTDGFNRVITSFEVEGRTYVRGDQGSTPFSQVVLKRIDNDVTGNKATAFFEIAEDPADENMYLVPEYVNDVEGLMNSYVFNRGSDNTLSNSGQTNNNVERIDLIFENGIKASSNPAVLGRSGILIMERGGNDSFKFAAITALSDGDKQVSGLGALKTADQGTAWGGTGVSFKSVVFQRDGGEAGNLKPSQLLAAQTVYGTFISLEDLGIGANEMFYGISLFANDVVSVGDGQNLIDLSDGFFTDTDGTSDGGLDFMAGGGFFTVAHNLGGGVFHDAAADPSLIDSHTGGKDGSETSGLTLYVSLTDMDENILATVPVENGSYTFNDIDDGNYRVVLHTNPAGSAVADLPGTWYATGEGADATKDGTADGVLTVSVPAAGDLMANNFGINIDPVVDILPIKADDDDFGTIQSTVDYTTPETIFANDSLNNVPVDLSLIDFKVDGAEVTTAIPLKEAGSGTDVPGVRLNPDGTVTVDAGTAPGTYTLDYTICEKAAPDNCDDATIVIKVAEDAVIKADDDDFGTIQSAVDYTTPETIFANDSLNNVPVDLSLIDFKVDGAEVTTAIPLKEAGSGTDVPGVRLNPDGTVTVDAGTAPGTYTLDYTICEKAAPDNCDDATIVIKVAEDAPIKADDDDFGTIQSAVDYTTPETIFANDSLNNVPVDLSLIDFKVDGAEVTTAIALKESGSGTDVPGVRLNPDGTVTVDAGTAPGTYTLDYTICEKAAPDNCDDATIVIKVAEDAPIKADDDDFGTIQSAVDYTTLETIFANDSLNNVPVDLSLIDFKVDGAEVTTAIPLKEAGSGTDVPGVRLNPDGTVTVDAGTAPGTYTLDYTICEKAAPDNCDDATIVIKVGAFDLALQKTVKAGQAAVFKEGDEVTFVITLKNEGTLDATDIEVVDYVPEGLELVGDEWEVTDGKAKLVTPVLSLPAGEEISLEITFKVTSDAKPSVRNAAEISAAKGGTDLDSTFDEDRNNDADGEDDFDTSLITICKKGGNCLPVKTTRIK